MSDMDLRNIFQHLYEDASARVSRRDRHVSLKAEGKEISEGLDLTPSGAQEKYFLQKSVRPIYGKHGVNDSQIGTHPDFLDLELDVGATRYHYACTMFVDIRGSTRLSLLYSLQEVFLIKNTVLQVCAETILALDGYVHRFMGDAVMGFFGGNDVPKEDAIADAFNCAVVLRLILEESIKPWMEGNGVDPKDFGFRIGCDFGDDREVLWGSFGYRNVGEVSAAGFPVDMASKLQSLSRKNQIMLGQGFIDYVNWPSEYSLVKKKTKGGEVVEFPFVTPNLSGKDGEKINYKMRELDYPKVLQITALPPELKEVVEGSGVKAHPAFTYKCFVLTAEGRVEYKSASRYLEKRETLLFEVKVETRHRLGFPLKVNFYKTNHGSAVPEEERDIVQNLDEKFLKLQKRNEFSSSIKPFSSVTLDESTLYRGLHTMKCVVTDKEGSVVFRDWIGVMIK